MNIVIGSDHAGVDLKRNLIDDLHHQGHQVLDVGTDTRDPVDYPDYAEKVGRAVLSGQGERGILICGSGVGASVCANKVLGVRAALIEDHFAARQGVEDDHLNMMCLGGRTVGPEVAWDLVHAFLEARYSQAERHLRRLAKVAAVEQR